MPQHSDESTPRFLSSPQEWYAWHVLQPKVVRPTSWLKPQENSPSPLHYVNKRTTNVNGAKHETPRAYISMRKCEVQRVRTILAERVTQRARVMQVLH